MRGVHLICGWLITWTTYGAIAQTVVFDVSPAGEAVTIPTPGTTPVNRELTLAPGSTLNYALGATVFPSVLGIAGGGLAAFDVSLSTNLGVQQFPLQAFDSIVQASMTQRQSRGTSSGDDVLNISAAQTSAGLVSTGIAVNTRQILGTGTLITPNTQGDFLVSVAGTAQVFATTGSSTPLIQTSATAAGPGIVLHLRSAATQPTPATPTAGGGEQTRVSLFEVCFPGAAGATISCTIGLVALRMLPARRKRM